MRLLTSEAVEAIFVFLMVVINSSLGKDCGFPGRPGNGTTIGAEKFFYPGEEVTFQCDNGFILFGGDRRICQEDGSWSGSLPECKFNMALMKAATQSETLWNYDPSLAVDGDTNTCSFTPQSDVQRWWQVHLTGSPRVGSVAITMSPGSYQHFTIFIVQLLEGNKAMYKPCAEFKGRFQEQKVFFKCKEGHSGQFVYIRDDRPDKEYFGLCEVEVFHYKETPECGDPEKPIYGVVKVHGEVAQYSCIPGYIRRGNATRKCTWSGWRPIEVSECIEVQCDHPPSTKDGFIEVANFKDSYIYGSKATYHCNPGFILWGNATRLCDANGQWTGSEPKCQPIACGDPVTLPHTTVALINGSTSWKAVAQYSCIFGYHSSANRTLIVESNCLQNGSWTPVEFNCVPNEDQIRRHDGSGGYFLSSPNVHTALSMPVLLSIVVIITVIIGIALSLVVFLVRKWYIKLTDYSPQHFILSNNGRKFKDLQSTDRSSLNNYATMPVSYNASRGSVDHLHSSFRGLGEPPVVYGGSLPRKLPRQSHQTPSSAITAFKYAETQDIASATLRHGCLQPQRATAASLHSLPHSYWTRPEVPKPDVLRQADPDGERTSADIINSAQAQAQAQEQTDRHVIVNQLLTFLTEQQIKDSDNQLIDFCENPQNHCSPSTASTMKLNR